MLLTISYTLKTPFYNNYEEFLSMNQIRVVYPCCVHCGCPKVLCNKCGTVQTDAPFERKNSRFTLMFEDYAMLIMADVPRVKAAKFLRCNEKSSESVWSCWVGDAVSRMRHCRLEPMNYFILTVIEQSLDALLLRPKSLEIPESAQPIFSPKSSRSVETKVLSNFCHNAALYPSCPERFDFIMDAKRFVVSREIASLHKIRIFHNFLGLLVRQTAIFVLKMNDGKTRFSLVLSAAQSDRARHCQHQSVWKEWPLQVPCGKIINADKRM